MSKLLADVPRSERWSHAALQEITLAEALCGTSFTIQHLDDRVLEVTSAPGEVIKPDSWKCIQDEGMPEHGRPMEHGNLYIQFHVKFPATMSPQQVTALRQVLGAPDHQPANGAMDVDAIEQVSPAALRLPLILHLQPRVWPSALRDSSSSPPEAC